MTIWDRGSGRLLIRLRQDRAVPPRRQSEQPCQVLAYWEHGSRQLGHRTPPRPHGTAANASLPMLHGWLNGIKTRTACSAKLGTISVEFLILITPTEDHPALTHRRPQLLSSSELHPRDPLKT